MKRVFSYNTATDLKTFEVEIKLATDCRLFFSGADVPKELVETYRGTIPKRIYSADFDGIKDKIYEIVADYEEKFITENKEKVILYALDFESRGNQHEIKFNYCVAQKIEFTKVRKGKKETECRYFEEVVRKQHFSGLSESTLDDLNTSREFDDTFKEMPWSKEREVWFETMSVSVGDLGLKLQDGFSTKAEILARNIDLGNASSLLLESGETHD